MTTFQALILGLVQGATEFLPISSTAHLRVVTAALGWGDAGAAFTAVLQLGSLAAIVGFFFRDLGHMARAAIDPARRREPDGRLLLYIVLGTLPIGVAGLLLAHAIEGPLRSLAVIGASLIAVGLVMAMSERLASHERVLGQMRLGDALLVGLAQALALVPGVSRSGITLACAMALGFRRDAAARFSFLLAVPAIAAAGLFELPDVLAAENLEGVPLLAGVLAAAVSGYASIAWLLGFLRTRTTMPFVVYRVLLGAGVLLAA